jgi:predicted nucleic acid-binding protein
MATPAPSLSETLALLHHNQVAIAAAVEEVSKWIAERGSVDVHENVISALATLDMNAKAIEAGIRAAASIG